MAAQAQLAPQQSPLAPASGPTDVNSILAAQPARVEELNKDVADTDTEVSKIEADKKGMKMPDLQPIPQPTPQQTNPAKVWGSAAMLFAGIGSMFTRTPAIAAMNAASQVFKAVQQQDQEATNTAFDSWKIANENMLKIADFQQKQYKDALDNADKDENAALAKLRAKMVAFHDTTGIQALDVHGLQGAQQHMLELERLAQQAKNAAPGVLLKKLEINAYYDVQTARKNLKDAQASRDPAKIKAAVDDLNAASVNMQDIASANGKGGASGSSTLSDDDLKSMAEQYLAGDKSVMTSMGYGSAAAANRARLQDMIRKTAKDQGMSGGDIAAAMAEFQGMTAGERTLGATQARIGLGAAEIQKLEPQVLEASQQLQRTNYPSFNAIIQAGQRGTGDPALKNLAVRLQGLKSAFSQVLTRGGVPTDSARSTTDELFNTKDPVPVMKQAMEAMNAETGAIEQAPGVVRQQLREGVSGNKGSTSIEGRGPAPAHIKGKPIWPEGDHWVYQDGSPVK